MDFEIIVALLVYGFCFLLYNTIYLHLTKKYPDRTKKGRINSCIASWLRETEENKQHLLVVHQVRNMIMSITFLASASILLIGFLLTYRLTELPTVKGLAGAGTLDYPGWLTFFTLAYAFLNLLLALRHLNNFTVLIRANRQKLVAIEGKSASAYLEKLFIKGSQRYMMGRRGLLYAIVVLFWYVNLWFFVGLIVLLTFTLSYNHDF